jgi:8-oxo-dGTP pyrophosphatase MutT (NUDIX family)
VTHWHVSGFYSLNVGGTTVGCVPLDVLKALHKASKQDWVIDEANYTVTLLGHSAEDRSAVVAKLLKQWREEETFAILKGWRNELYAVYEAPGVESFRIERSGAGLFGVLTFGVHMTAYIPATATTPLKIWVARRSATKSSYPNMLDNAAAGGLSAGERPLACMIREAEEEASLPENIVSKDIKSVGVVSYFYLRDGRAGGETGLPEPECQYLYDLPLSADQILKPNDNEVGSFQLLTVEEVQQRLANDEFKPNCAIVMTVRLQNGNKVNE